MSLPRGRSKIGSQHASVKDNLETFCEGLAGGVAALCSSPDIWTAPSSNLGGAGMGLLWFTSKTKATPRCLRDSRDHGWQYGTVQFPPAPVNPGRWQAWFHPICLGEIYVVISSPHVTVWLKNSPDGLPVCCDVPVVSVGSVEAPALFALSVSQACYE